MTFATKGLILDAAEVLDPPKPKARRVEQKPYGKELFLRVT